MMRFILSLMCVYLVVGAPTMDPIENGESPIATNSASFSVSLNPEFSEDYYLSNKTDSIVEIQGDDIGVPCEFDEDCGKHSKGCIDAVCKCKSGWVSRKVDDPCGYERKSNGVAFLWAFFFGFTGANWFYLARGDVFYGFLGFFKLCALFLGLCDSEKTHTSVDAQGNETKTVRKTAFPGVLWWFLDWVLIAFHAIPDGNSVGLA